MLSRRTALMAGAATLATTRIASAQARPIRIGEINSYTTLAAFTEPYRKGWMLAQEQANRTAARPFETLFRDDGGRPDQALSQAQALLSTDGCDFLAGTFLSNVGLAVSDFARANRRLFVASEPLTDALVWSQGHRYCFRLRPSTYMQAAMLAEEAAKLPARRWATVAPNYEYGQSAVRWFKELLSRARPDVVWVGEQWPAQGRIDAGATVQALLGMQPEAIFNATFAADLLAFVRQGQSRGLFRNRAVVSLLSGEPEYLEPLGDEAPEGWIVTGYPAEQIATPEHTMFRDAYRARFNELPKLGSIVGYVTMQAIAAAVARAGSAETEALVEAFRGLTWMSPFGPTEFRAIDHQATLGAYVGRTAVRGGRGVMVDWRYADGRAYLPADDIVRQWRPQG
ncbi:MAG: ABC transporter substrate-binding protein [Alphaproteobacteria bacterium]|nr:ABC transporter substrate-binding protein [Alphaproteobacteria bacterium]